MKPVSRLAGLHVSESRRALEWPHQRELLHLSLCCQTALDARQHEVSRARERLQSSSSGAVPSDCVINFVRVATVLVQRSSTASTSALSNGTNDSNVRDRGASLGSPCDLFPLLPRDSTVLLKYHRVSESPSSGGLSILRRHCTPQTLASKPKRVTVPYNYYGTVT